MKKPLKKPVLNMWRLEKGQSLVETALILPFLLILIIGLVEAGFVLQRQIIVVNAAREGARFGAYGASADDIYAATLIATSRMFEFTEENTVIAVIQAQTNDVGNDFKVWIENVYPESADVPYITQGDVLKRLNDEGDAANLYLVIVDIYYDHESVLGLPLVGALVDKIPIGSWTVMRVPEFEMHKGPSCCALPITLPIWDVEGLSRGDRLVDIRQGGVPGQFGWLYWNPDNNGDAVNLDANLRDRCRAKNFRDACTGNRKLTIGSWVSGAAGEMDSAKDALEMLIGSHFPVPVWDRFEMCNPNICGCKPGTKVIRIAGFALMEITEVKFASHPKTISAIFRGWYDGCD